MGFIHLLVLSFGALTVAVLSQEVTKCVPETARCRRFWTRIEPHRNLWETEKELNTWCRTQNRFYECLEGILLEGKNGNLSYLPTNLLISKLFAKDLCSDGSHNRWRLLDNAACMNSLDTDYCTRPEYLDIVTFDEAIPASRCSFSAKTFDCINATFVLNCGFDAGRVYLNMLMITRFNNEFYSTGETETIPPCTNRESMIKRRFDQIYGFYYELVRRIGIVPEQENEIQSSSKAEQGQLEFEQLDANQPVADAVQEYLDRIGSMPQVENEVQGALKEEKGNQRTEQMDLNKYVADVSGYTLNPLGNSMDEVEYMMADEDQMSKVSEENKLHKRPIITDVFKGILFYNYSDVDYAVYWRQPDFTGVQNISCVRFRNGDNFGCRILDHYRDPDCLSKDTVHERVTPELVRDLDPEVPDDSIVEFGPHPYWMKNLQKAQHLRILAKAIEPVNVYDNTDFSTTGIDFLHLITSVVDDEAEYWREYEFGRHANGIIPNDIILELMKLFLPEPENYEPPPIYKFRVGHFYFIFIYDPEFRYSMEKATCSRLDECHPKGWGLWKCKILPLKIETGRECHGSREKTEDFHFVKERTDPIIVSEGSGLLESREFSTSVEPENVHEHESGSGYDQSTDYLDDEDDFDDDLRAKCLSEEDDFYEKEIQEAINDFNLLLIDSILNPSKYVVSWTDEEIRRGSKLGRRFRMPYGT